MFIALKGSHTRRTQFIHVVYDIVWTLDWQGALYKVVNNVNPKISADCVQHNLRSDFHYENTPMQYKIFFSAVKVKNFNENLLIFLIF